MRSWQLPAQKTKKLAIFFESRFLKKSNGPLPMKSVTFCWTWIFSWKI
jgi:hypothetical protein